MFVKAKDIQYGKLTIVNALADGCTWALSDGSTVSGAVEIICMGPR